jgi:hypothetical protein
MILQRGQCHLAFGLPYAELNLSVALGSKVETLNIPKRKIEGVKATYAYCLNGMNYIAPAALYELLNAGMTVKVATKEFEITVNSGNKKFDYGTILIPVKNAERKQ